MAILATDNFNRANGNLGTGNWTSSNASPQSLVIVSNAITPGYPGGPWDVQYWNALSWNNGQWAQVTLGSVDTANGAAIGVGVRAAGSGNFYYVVAFPLYGVYQVGKNVGGTNSLLTNISLAPVIGDVIYMEIQGTTLKTKINGVVKDSRTVTDLATGSAGAGVYGNDSALNADNWIGGNFLAPSPASLSASSGTQGATLSTFTVSGTSFDSNGASTLSFSGTGITVNSYTVQNSTTITASITIASNATVGARDVVVTNYQGQTGTLAASFTVMSSAPPPAPYSVPDCRNYGHFPNSGITNQGTILYTGQTSSNPAVPGTDSRATGAPTDSRTNKPTNSRTSGTFGPGE